jgi:glycine dehydrogenase subunit 1
MVCQLTGMDVANASLYDGASSLAEAVSWRPRPSGRRRIVMARTVHPSGGGGHLPPIWITTSSRSATAPTAFERATRLVCDSSAIGAVRAGPNYFGVVESTAQRPRAVGAPVTASRSRSRWGCCAPGTSAPTWSRRGQAFGNPVSFGGPYLGLYATRDKYLRQMPGRLAGEARDVDGKRGFVLTLSTREQHIRRGKATSNICTNQGLCALAATIHLALLGRRGLASVARLNHARAEYAKKALASAGARLGFTGPTFNEFVVRVGGDAEALRDRLLERGIWRDIRWAGSAPASAMLAVCVTRAAHALRSTLSPRRFGGKG